MNLHRDKKCCLRISIIDRLFILFFSFLILEFFINSITVFFLRCRIEILRQPFLSLLTMEA